ncbi:hypothetical protein C9374_007480 [Naegleria lovaniensis]|uniref:Uncharacterized protein n=1 Tax=Naegleria lovaniensis TaxID=51637 RepID=A0AA88GMX3_NAELO|nr:uncharacterized protein C9374_007480 [Naegleria lovaniensis]KAG2379341.1 hypothetical protein C9374_007480 [Naegleria lovaniensis]
MFPVLSEKKVHLSLSGTGDDELGSSSFQPKFSSSPIRTFSLPTGNAGRLKDRLKEKSSKGYKSIVHRLHQHLETEKMNQQEAKTEMYQRQASKMKKWNRLISSIDSWTLHSIEYHMKEKDKLRNSLPCFTQSSVHYDEKKKEELIKLATLEAKERCTIRKRVQEKRASLDAFERLLQYQYKRRKAFENGQLTLFKDEYYEEEMKNFMKEEIVSSVIEKAVNTSHTSMINDISHSNSEPIELDLGSPRTVLTSVNIVKRMPDEKVFFLTKDEINKLEAIKEQKRLENERLLELERQRKEEEKQQLQLLMEPPTHNDSVVEESKNDLDNIVSEESNHRASQTASDATQAIHQIVNGIIQNIITRCEIQKVVSHIVAGVIKSHSQENKNIISIQKEREPSIIINNIVKEIITRVVDKNQFRDKVGFTI